MQADRRNFAATVVCVTMVVTGCSAAGSASSCVEPTAQASVSQAAPGDIVRLTGRYWQPCNDTNHASDPPWPEVTLSWVQDGHTYDEQRIPISDGGFAGDFEIPVEAGEGTGTIEVHSAIYTVQVDLQIDPTE